MKNALEWTLTDQTKKIIIQPKKMSLFQQCTLIECMDEVTNTHYLLFFYKNNFLTARPKTAYEPTSFLAQIETKGIHINAPSPLFSLPVHPGLSLQIIPFNQLLGQIKRNYSLAETALIFSYFDSYIPHVKLDKILKDFFFSYRRNGQLTAAYRLAMSLLARGYEQDWLLQSMKQPDYAKATKRYQGAPAALLSSDPIYVEQLCFNDQTPENHELLLTIYTNEANSIHALMLNIDKWTKNPTIETYVDFTHALSSHLEEDDVLSCLLSLQESVPVTSGLHQDLYERLTKKLKYQQAIQILLTYSFPLSSEQQNQLPTVFESVTLAHFDVPIKDMTKRMFTLLKDQPILLERLVRSALPALFQSYDLASIHAWLHEANPKEVHIPILNKLNEMVALLDEPDKQMELGHHYFELAQYEKAIDCFNWELELQPNQLEPLQWLAKSYQQLGKTEEAKTYQQILSHMQGSP